MGHLSYNMSIVHSILFWVNFIYFLRGIGVLPIFLMRQILIKVKIALNSFSPTIISSVLNRTYRSINLSKALLNLSCLHTEALQQYFNYNYIQNNHYPSNRRNADILRWLCIKYCTSTFKTLHLNLDITMNQFYRYQDIYLYL